MPVRNITSEDDFNTAIKGADVVVVDFFATWCGPCRTISPHVESLSETLVPAAQAAKEKKQQENMTGEKKEGEEKEGEVEEDKKEALVFLKVDVDEMFSLSQSLNVTAMPTFLMFKKGELAKTVVGARPEEIDAKLDELLEEVFDMPTRAVA